VIKIKVGKEATKVEAWVGPGPWWHLVTLGLLGPLGPASTGMGVWEYAKT
tara:strand:+ start:365 stop:514 length:150 start_codon:yes stop_codon:yes gene_type:complete